MTTPEQHPITPELLNQWIKDWVTKKKPTTPPLLIKKPTSPPKLPVMVLTRSWKLVVIGLSVRLGMAGNGAPNSAPPAELEALPNG